MMDYDMSIFILEFVFVVIGNIRVDKDS